MNVWIVNPYAIPPSQAGITRHHMLADALQRRGHRTTIVAASFDHVMRRETRLGPGETHRLETEAGVPFLWLRTPAYSGNSPRRIWNMLVFAWRVRRRTGMAALERPDVVIGSSPHLFGAHATLKVARALRVPFVLEVRDLWPASLVELGNVSARHPVVRSLAAIERTLYREAAQVITLLPGAIDHIAAHGGARERIVWIPNGVQLEVLKACPPRAAGSGPLSVMYLGTHGLANALDTVLDVAARLRGQGAGDTIRFRLVGDGPHKPALIERARRDGLDAMVRFDDPVPKHAVPALLAEADVLIHTAHPVGLYRFGISPNKLFDYLGAARPVVIAMNTPHNPVAASGAGRCVAAGDVAGIAAAILELEAAGPEGRAALGRRGRRYVEAHHDIERLAERLEGCLLAARDGRDPPATLLAPAPAC